MNEAKFSKNQRTFLTRLLFLQEIYSGLFTQVDIMASCIAHKLDRSYLAYLEELQNSTYATTGEDPLDVLKNLN